MSKDYMAMYEGMKGNREPYIIKSQAIARLVQDTMRLDPYGPKNSPKSIQTPFSDVGPRCCKGFASVVSNLLNPPNLSSFKLENNVKLGLNPQEQNLLDSLYIAIEKNINSFKDQNGYKPYQYQSLMSAAINGQIVTKISNEGYLRYDLDSFTVSRHRNQLEYAIFEECIYNDDNKEIPQYIYVDYQDNEVYLQIANGKPEKQTGEDASQYVISSLIIPVNENYAQSIFADHYGVLAGINKSWEYLEEAQDLAGYNIQTFTGPSTISTKDIARIPRRSVIRVPNHDVLQWNGVGSNKLQDWNFIATLVTGREQQLLQSFGIGLLERAGQLQTATEVRAVINELIALTGPLAIVWSDTFTSPILDAEMKVLDVKNRLRIALANNGLQIPAGLIDKLIVPVVVSGVSSFARAESAQAMLDGISQIIQKVGVTPEAVNEIIGSIDIGNVIKTYLENTNVDTTNIYKPYVAPQVPGAAGPQGPAPSSGQVNAVSSLPPELIATLPDNIKTQGPEAIAQYLLAQNQNPSQ